MKSKINPQTVLEAFTKAEQGSLDFISPIHLAPAKPSLIDLEYIKL